MIRAVGGKRLQKMIREPDQPIRRDKDTIKELQRRKHRSTGPSKAASSEANLIKLRPINECPESCHASSVKPVVVLISSAKNHVEITTDTPGSIHTISKGEELIHRIIEGSITPSPNSSLGRVLSSAPQAAANVLTLLFSFF